MENINYGGFNGHPPEVGVRRQDFLQAEQESTIKAEEILTNEKERENSSSPYPDDLQDTAEELELVMPKYQAEQSAADDIMPKQNPGKEACKALGGDFLNKSPSDLTISEKHKLYRQHEYSKALSMPISQLKTEVQRQPKPRNIFRGINHPGVGVFFGPSKGGKTIFTENFLLTLSAGRPEFLGESMFIPHRHVLFFSLEEYYIHRTERNKLQIAYLQEAYHLEEGWDQNYHVLGEAAPKYLHSEGDWTILEREIEITEPSVVVIDSLGRLSAESIEKSTVAIRLMKRLRAIAEKYGITLIVIHHTHKLKDQSLIMSNMAGSRVISQECDFIIGVNRLSNGSRYIKDIAYRYHSDDSDEVLSIAINANSFVEPRGFFTEADLISGLKPPELNPSDELVIKFFKDFTEGEPSVIMEHSILKERLVDSKELSGPTLHASLSRLQLVGVIKKIKRGQYVMI